jgi:TRAP-type C4-dicarboxylate transport system substrate-binding protein
MLRKVSIAALVACASLVGPGYAKTAAADEKKPVVIKLSTLAPKVSSWGNVFQSWARTVKKETGGACEIEWAYSGTDEGSMIGGMRSGDRHGGALTATGLASIYPSVLALQMPGLTDDWTKFDSMRDKVRDKFNAAFEATSEKKPQAFKILGWGDVGIGHIMFRDPPKEGGGFQKPEIHTPADLKAYNTFYIAGDPIGSKFLEAVGIGSPRALSVAAILPALAGRETSSIDIITTPAIAAEQLQWAPHVTHVVDMPVGFGIGALVVDKKFYEALPGDCKKVFEETGKNASATLTSTIRGKDLEAWNGLKASKKVVTLSDADKKAWEEKFAVVRNKLRDEGKIDKDIWNAVMQAAGKN